MLYFYLSLINKFTISFFRFICFWLHWIFVTVQGLSLLVIQGFSLQWLLLLWSLGSGTWASIVAAHEQSCLLTCGIFLGEDRTRVPRIGRQIPNHWPPGKPYMWFIFKVPTHIYRWIHPIIPTSLKKKIPETLMNRQHSPSGLFQPF